MTVSPMLRAAAVRQLSDTISAGNNDDAESNWSYPITSLVSAAAVCLVIISFCGLARCLYRRCGWARWCGVESDTLPQQTQSERQQMLEDERLAMQLQQEMEDERKQQTVKQIRNARRHKYKQFLAPYTLTVAESDLYTPSKDSTTKASESTRTCSCASKNGNDKDDSTLHESDSSDEEDVRFDDKDARFDDKVVKTRPNLLKRASSLLSMSTSPRSNTPHERLLRHPCKKSDNTLADVEASCSICLLDYEEGDRVVFSTRSICPHAFHEDCIMMWLEKGKKRCPICRNFFVPGQAMDDKPMIQHDDDDAHAIRITKDSDQDNTNNDPTDIEECLHHEQTDADMSSHDRSRSGTIVTTATSGSMHSSESGEAFP